MHSIIAVRFVVLYMIPLVVSFVNPAWSAVPEEGYTFGIGPVQSATELAKRWTPIMQYLTEKSGVPLQFKTSKDIPTFQQQMSEGAYDFAHINPYHYLLYHKSSGYTAFAREKDGKLVGVLLVKKDGPIQEVSQLSAKTIAFPAANALAATWLPMHMLQEKNIAVTPQYVNSMDSVYRSVAKGLFPAGGGEMRTFGTIDPEVKSQLRILWISDALPPFAFAAHSRVPKKIVAKVQKAIVEMDTDPRGIELLKANNFKGIEFSNDAEYDAMRKMNIKPVVAK
jgi:phosphonate transport system substrate-binding protein